MCVVVSDTNINHEQDTYWNRSSVTVRVSVCL